MIIPNPKWKCSKGYTLEIIGLSTVQKIKYHFRSFKECLRERFWYPTNLRTKWLRFCCWWDGTTMKERYPESHWSGDDTGFRMSDLKVRDFKIIENTPIRLSEKDQERLNNDK